MDKDELTSLKLCDFGLCNDKENEIPFEGKMGTPLYMAPEQMLRKFYCKAVDIWAVGIIMYIIISGKHPLHTPEDTRETYTKKLENPQFHFSKEFSNLSRNLFVKLCANDPLVRYKAGQALKHPWITRLRTDIPMNLFETIRSAKTLESLENVIKSLIFITSVRGENAKISEEYEEMIKNSSKEISEWYKTQEKTNKKLLLNDDDFYKNEAHSPIPKSNKLLQEEQKLKSESPDNSPIYAQKHPAKKSAFISYPLSRHTEKDNSPPNSGVSSKYRTDEFHTFARNGKPGLKSIERNMIPLRLSQQMSIQNPNSQLPKQAQSNSPPKTMRKFQSVSKQSSPTIGAPLTNSKRPSVNIHIPAISLQKPIIRRKDLDKGEKSFALNLYQTATKFNDLSTTTTMIRKNGRKASQEMILLEGGRTDRVRNAAERLGYSPVRGQLSKTKAKVLYKL